MRDIPFVDLVYSCKSPENIIFPKRYSTWVTWQLGEKSEIGPIPVEPQKVFTVPHLVHSQAGMDDMCFYVAKFLQGSVTELP